MNDDNTLDAFVNLIVVFVGFVLMVASEVFTFYTYWGWIQKTGLMLPDITPVTAFLIVNVTSLLHPSYSTILQLSEYLRKSSGLTTEEYFLVKVVSCIGVCTALLILGWIAVHL